MIETLVSVLSAAVVVWLAWCSIVIVPEQHAVVIERLGRYHATLLSGPHLRVPVLDRVRHRHILKEQTLDIPQQTCITKDDVQVGVDGVLYLQVIDPEQASYGIDDYRFALSQIAQTTLRSEIGRMELDQALEERTMLNASVLHGVADACEPWGVRLLRYEITDINPPHSVLEAMEKQMRAEREKRATVLLSEGERMRRVNEARGKADAIRAVSEATLESLRSLASALQDDSGREAMELRIAESYVEQFGRLAEGGNTMIVPTNVGDIAGMIATASRISDRARAT